MIEINSNQVNIWADIEDDEENGSPQINQNNEQQEDPTGEAMNARENRQPHKQFTKKPLLTKPQTFRIFFQLIADQMIEQIKNDKPFKIYIHCFSMNGNSTNFRETFQDKVRFVNLIDTKKADRDNSIDLKFDNQEEAIKFIELSQTTPLNGRNFRVKFGKNLRTNDNFKKNDYKSENNQRTGHFEKKEHKYGERQFNRNRDDDHQGHGKFGNREKGEFVHREKGEYRNREKGEYKPHYKRENQNEMRNEERQNDNKQELNQQGQTEAFKPRGFVNTKKETNVTQTTVSGENIQCVDTNAKIVEKQKLDEQEKSHKVDEPMKENNKQTEQKTGNHQTRQNGKYQKENESFVNNTNTQNKSQQEKPQEKQMEKVNQKKNEEVKSQKPKEQTEKKQTNEKENSENNVVEDEWNVVGGKTTEKKPRYDDRRGKGGNNQDSKRNNNTKKTYERRTDEKK